MKYFSVFYLSKRIAHIFILIIGLVNFSAIVINAAPGDLDPAFGTNGKVILRLGEGTEIFTGVAAQTDGKIVACGRDSGGRLIVARYLSNGTLDNTFSSGGIFVFNSSTFSVSEAIALQPDGHIIVAGTIRIGPPDDAILVIRLTPDGVLDNTFNGSGIVQTNITPGIDRPRDITIQADGKIVLTGAANLAGHAISDMALLRYNSNGSPDETFGQNGQVIFSIDENADHGYALKIQKDGKIVVLVDSTDLEGELGYQLLIRFLADGSLDPDFGVGGVSTTELGSDIFAFGDLEFQTDGKIVVTNSIGSNNSFVYSYTVSRYSSTGIPDTSFGTNGKTIIIQNNVNLAQTLLIQPDGKIISVGYSEQAEAGTLLDILLVRLNSNGSLDPSFGNGGKVFTPVAKGNRSDYSFDAVFQNDGKILVAGNFNVSGLFDYDAVLLRYFGDPVNQTRAVFDFDGDGKTDVSIYRPSAGEWWYMRSSDSSNRAFGFGSSTDKIAPADYTGDGKTDIAFWRESTGEWFILRSEDSSFYSFPFGTSGDIPAPADFDGDGTADVAIFRPTNAMWYIIRSSDSGTTITNFGANGDQPVAADYDGDGFADIAVFRPSDGSWWINRSQAGLIVTNFGTSSDKTVQADYTGDGKTDVAFYRPLTGEWFILRSEDSSFYSIPFGAAGDIAAPGDYDGDGAADYAVFRPSNATWYVQQSTNGFAAVGFGAAGDRPVPNAFVR